MVFVDVLVNGLIIYRTIVELEEFVELVKFEEFVVETILYQNYIYFKYKKNRYFKKFNLFFV